MCCSGTDQEMVLEITALRPGKLVSIVPMFALSCGSVFFLLSNQLQSVFLQAYQAQGGGGAVHQQGDRGRPHHWTVAQRRGSASVIWVQCWQVAGDYRSVLPTRKERQRQARLGGVVAALHLGV